MGIEGPILNCGSCLRFANVEELLLMFDDDVISRKNVIRIIKKYLADDAHAGASSGTISSLFFAIMSYFEKNECPLGMKYDARKHDTQELKDDAEMTLYELRRMLVNGKPSVMLRSIVLAKFQAGLDSSTMADRFNYDAYPQIVKYL